MARSVQNSGRAASQHHHSVGGNTRNLRKNLDSIFDLTLYPNYEVVIIDNSRGDEVKKLISLYIGRASSLRYIDWRDRPFNFSGINNLAARQCVSPLLLFLNDDMSVIAPDWLDSMVEQAIRPEVGAVGAKLLYPGGTIQHAGIFMGFRKNCGHAFRGLPSEERHYFDLPNVIRNVSAVTGACLMTRADVFWETGAFDSENLPIDLNDVDLCLKIRAMGYRIVYTPYALLRHYESASKQVREILPEIEQVNYVQHRWRDEIADDPYYNRNLTRDEGELQLEKTSAGPGIETGSVRCYSSALERVVLFNLRPRPSERPTKHRCLALSRRPGTLSHPGLSNARFLFSGNRQTIGSGASSTIVPPAIDFQTLFPDLERSGRVKILKLDTPHGISSATNKGIEIASGRYLCFLDHDDLLSPDALSSLAEACREGYDAIYTDSDKTDEAGLRFEPFHKPDWSPAYFRGVMYIGHLLCVRRDLTLEVGGFDSRFDGIQVTNFSSATRSGRSTYTTYRRFFIIGGLPRAVSPRTAGQRVMWGISKL